MKNSKLRNAVYGAAVGDALGVPFEFKERGSFTCEGMVGHGTHNQPAGTWSDDTSLILATCDSIRENEGRVDISDMREKFVQWYKEGRYACGGQVFDIGATTANALTQGVGQSDEHDNGNGSLMRILPIAFVPGIFNDLKMQTIAAVSAITHAHETSMDACIEYCMTLSDISDGVKDPEYFATLLNNLVYHDPSLPESKVRSTGYVVDTFFAALWCFATTDSYKDCVLAAVNLGGDTDTIACVAGGLAGLYYTINDIPDDWIDTLRDKDLIESCLF